jgi:hypothetical protein
MSMGATGPPAEPPKLSPDGKFYWDETRWVPMPAAAATIPVSPVKALPNRLAGGLVTVGGAIAVIGCFLPWISASAFIATLTRDGISLPDGQIVAALATISALFGVVMLARRVTVLMPIVLLLTAALAMWTVVADYQHFNSRVPSLGSDTAIVAQIGVGIYATGLGVIIWAIGALAGIPRKGALAT